MLAADPTPESIGREIGKAVAIAALCAIATKLVDWGVEELRERVSPKKKPEGSDEREQRQS